MNCQYRLIPILVCLVMLVTSACTPRGQAVVPTLVPTPTAAMDVFPTSTSEYFVSTPTRTSAPTAVPAGTALAVEATQPAAAAPGEPYTLAILEEYRFFPLQMNIGMSITGDGSGSLWLGALDGTLQQVDAASGDFKRTVRLPGGGANQVEPFPVHQIAVEGTYLWAFASLIKGGDDQPHLFVVDPAAGTVRKDIDMNEVSWLGGEERVFSPEGFGVSTGKIWIDNHVVDAQTFEAFAAPMPGMTRFADSRTGWMWMTGDTNGACEELFLASTEDPSDTWCPDRWPFLAHGSGGTTGAGPGSTLQLAGNLMWVGGIITGSPPVYTLDAYPANIDLAMAETGPSNSIPLPDSPENLKMAYAAGYLWAVYTGGENAGWLYQLDAKTGETVNSIDLVGDEGRDISDIPMGLAAEGDSLWVLTARRLLRLPLP